MSTKASIVVIFSEQQSCATYYCKMQFFLARIFTPILPINRYIERKVSFTRQFLLFREPGGRIETLVTK